MTDVFPSLPPARPVFSRPGGKTRMLKYILPLIPPHTCYCEPFFGGGAVFFAKPESPVEVINDRDASLTALLRNAKYHLDALLDETDLILNARREFEDFVEQEGLTEIQRAARWFVRNKLSFGGSGANYAIVRTQPLPSRTNRMVALRSLSARLDRTSVEQRDWAQIVGAYDAPGTFFFFDPPYFDDGSAAYVGWTEDELRAFCTRIQQLQGAWMMTFQDCAQIREMLAGYPIQAIQRANGIGNRTGKRGRTYAEVIITHRCKPVARNAAKKGRTA
ncbi:DNA adenine methylase [Horticoccus luteus]|uniref:DNA adenine methylase n=1 Tax=Horticoccus luteus TaxID=2862869 RepID=A0A8F9TYN6_9BACT|nr:DNA adenine methylase [Horticoccus luteus]QYM80284.1 DNA adenine methylase [Horticoccus luteus]